MKMTAASVAVGVAATASLSLSLLSQTSTPAGADGWRDAPRVMRLVAPPRLPDAVRRVARDPFALADAGTAGAAPAEQRPPSTPAGRASAVTIAPPVTTGTTSAPGVVPNPGGDVSVAEAGGVVPQGGDARIVVIGTVVGGGRQAVALVRNGTEVDYVHVGDTLGARRVTGIYAQGIQFDDGSRLAIMTSSSPAQREAGPTQAAGGSASAPGVKTQLDAAQAVQAARVAGSRAGYKPLPPGAVPTINPQQTALPTVTTQPYDANATANPYDVATPNPEGTPHYNSTTPVPAPTPPGR